jgi:hypothetical protein
MHSECINFVNLDTTVNSTYTIIRFERFRRFALRSSWLLTPCPCLAALATRRMW